MRTNSSVRVRGRLLRRLAACVTLACGPGCPGGGRASVAEVGRPILRNYLPGDHLRFMANPTVTQDASGVIVMAAGGHLVSYNGARWRDILLPTESAGVRRFVQGPDGTIHLGGPGVLGYLQGTGDETHYVSLVDHLPAAHRNVEEIRYVVAFGNTLAFSDAEKILLWRDGRFTVIPFRTEPHAQGARLHAVGDTLFVTALDRPLLRLAHDRLEPVIDDPVLRTSQIVAVEAGDTPGTLVLLTAERGFFQLARGRVAPLPLDANRWLIGKRVFRTSRLPDGSRAVAFSAVSGNGGARFDPAGRYVGPIDTSIGLVVNSVRDFFRDREGGLWIGLEAGSARLEWPSATSMFDVVNGLGQGAVTGLARHDRVLHVATDEGVFQLKSADELGRPAHFERVFHQAGFALASHAAGLLALGYRELFVRAAHGFVPVATVPRGGGALLVSQRDPARVWVGSARGLQSFRHTAGGWQAEGEVAGFEENCRALAESRDGALWVAAAERGFFRLKFPEEENARRSAPQIERFGGGDGLPLRFASANLAAWDGEPVFTVNTAPGPFRFEAARRRFVALSGAESLPNDAAPECPLPGPGWLARPDAIYQLAPGGAVRRLPHTMLAAAGAATQLLEEKGPDGPVLWIGGARGLVRVEIARAFVPAVPFAVKLAAASLRPGDLLPPEHAPLAFSYVAPRHRTSSAVVYQTRLVGRDRDWSAWEPKRERIFPHLPPGRYRFEARARDADGVISAPASLPFTVLAPWWRTWWAILGYVAAGSGLMTGLVRRRTRALRQRAARLEQIVAVRTVELADKNRELTRLHQLEFDEKIAARLAEEKARLEVLRYQLNPHFLFNTLASISAALPTAHSPARAMVERLAEFCRLTLRRGDNDEWTTLGTELRLLRAYLEIERSRWGELLDLTIDYDAALEAERVPNFLLLPLLENALKYGRATSPDRVGIRLVARCTADDELLLEVANTGAWVAPATTKTVSSLGIGLENLRERLTRYYPGSHALTVVHAEGWVTVTLRLVNDRIS